MLKFFTNFKKYTFRLELLQEYDVEEEKEIFEEFLKTGEVPESCLNDWHDIIRKAKNRGAEMKRVHVIKLPPSDYLKFELKGYEYNQKAGEDIRLILKDQYDKLKLNQNFDFWLFDNREVLKMNYTKKGKFQGFELIDKDISKFIRVKSVLLEESIRLGDFT